MERTKPKMHIIMKQRYDFLKRRSIQLITLYPEISGAKENTQSIRTADSDPTNIRRIIRDQALNLTQMTWENVLKDVNYSRYITQRVLCLLMKSKL